MYNAKDFNKYCRWLMRQIGWCVRVIKIGCLEFWQAFPKRLKRQLHLVLKIFRFQEWPRWLFLPLWPRTLPNLSESIFTTLAISHMVPLNKGQCNTITIRFILAHQLYCIKVWHHLNFIIMNCFSNPWFCCQGSRNNRQHEVDHDLMPLPQWVPQI